MHNSEKKSIFILILLLAIAIFNSCIYSVFETINLRYIVFWILLLAFSIIMLGYKKDKSLNKIDIIQIIIIYFFTYLIITYIGGIIFGFTKSPYSLHLTKILMNVMPVFCLIILQEFFRYIIMNGNKNKFIFFLTVFSFSILEITMSIKNYNLTVMTELFEFVGYLVIPSIVNNIFFTFLTKYSGHKPTIIYRVIMELYIYFVPIFPEYGVYIQSLLNIFLPAILFLRLNSLFVRNRYITNRKNKVKSIIFTVPVVSLLLTIIALISGLFSYYAMAIGSNSMLPKISKGDAVIVEKIKDNDISSIKIGDIIVYNNHNKIIVHRVVRKTLVNNSYIFNTKGDNNESEDSWDIYENDILGIVRSKVPFIGYPSVWLQEALKK